MGRPGGAAATLPPDQPTGDTAGTLANAGAAAAAGGSINNTCLVVSLIPRAVFLLIMFGLNLVMVASFMQGMSESGTVIATALFTGTNFAVSVSSITIK